MSEESVSTESRWTWKFCFVVSILCLAVSAHSLDWENGKGFRSAQVMVEPGKRAGFSRLTSSTTGINFTNLVPESRHLTNQILLNGSGAAAGDVDGDGWCDLYFSALDQPNRLYRNLGNWRFEEIAQSAGVACPDLASTGVALADLDGDNDLDLVVNSIGAGTRIYFNQGNLRFLPGPVLNGNKGGMSLAVGDIDGDGFLDLYISNYRTSALMDIPNARATFKRVDGRIEMDRLNGRSVTEPDLQNRFVVSPRRGVEELGEADSLYRNHGGTNFVLMPYTGGAFLNAQGNSLPSPLYEWGLDAMFRDINGDTFPDLYVCNDFYSEDRVWLNDGTGRFREGGPFMLRKSSLFSMGVDFADINRDGFDDFLVVDMLSRSHHQRMTQMGDSAPPLLAVGEVNDRPQYGINTLFLNRGDGSYAEIAQLSGLEASDWSWMPMFLDVDLDGWEDVLVSNGNERAARDFDVAERLKAMRAEKPMSDAEVFEARRLFPRLASPNLAFRNRGDLTFEEAGAAWGFNDASVSHGMAVADLDNDGDLDVVVNNFNAEAGIYRNEASAPRVAVRLKGNGANTHGAGARISVYGGAVPSQSQEIVCGGRYLSSDELMRVFAAGTTGNEMTIEVKWRSGRMSTLPGATANRIYEIDESVSQETKGGSSSNGNRKDRRDQESRPPLFQDVSVLLNHRHPEEPYDDFARQPLLPKRLSQLGPGVAWFDWDADGWDDLLIGSGKGGRMGVFHNNGGTGFSRWEKPPLTIPVTRDQSGLVVSELGPKRIVLLSGSSNYEDGLPIGASVRQYGISTGVIDDGIPGDVSSAGPLAVADIDGDGDLDLFAGGRTVPGRYPAAASSRLFRNEKGKFLFDSAGSKIFDKIGLVSGAVFSDLDGDGDSDLVLACEWGPVRIFLNKAGAFSETTAALGMEAYRGWWNGVSTGDFDGDGRMDIAASNWGRNSPYESHRAKALRIYYGDFDGDSIDDLIEAFFDREIGKFVPERQLGATSRAMPFVRERLKTNAAYAVAGVEEILGERSAAAKVWEAEWLDSTVFLNRGNHFEPRTLPVEAQMAPAFGVSIGDIDGDGHEDLFLSQNFYATQPEVPRYDAGLGLWLKGDGMGGFRAMNHIESGVQIYGEQRGSALADFDRDGRIDLVVSQNGGETKLYRNIGGKPGLRVRLEGPSENPSAIGATIQIISGSRSGPMREIHAGSGYWSQDSAVQIMSISKTPALISIRWPGGEQQRLAIPEGAQEVRISMGNELQVVR
ncbi:MAG: VCBS repeat-containing protein [Verrucomicrobia bacterium]|nr:VCBS repeat-containing protein [Verrucomicrobiota bacterium]